MKSENTLNRYNEVERQMNISISDFLSKNNLNDKRKLNSKKFRFLSSDGNSNKTDNSSLMKKQNYHALFMILLYYLILIFILSISGKDKRKDAEIFLNIWVGATQLKKAHPNQVLKPLNSTPSISDEQEDKNYKNVSELNVSATKQKNFEFNFNESLSFDSSSYSVKKPALSKSNEKNNSIQFSQKDPKNEKPLLNLFEVQNGTKQTENNLKTEKTTNPKRNVHIRVSFVMPKKKNNEILKLKKLDSRRRSSHSFTKSMTTLGKFEEYVYFNYLVDSIFPFFSILRYKSKCNPKLKRILQLGSTFKFYMMFSSIFIKKRIGFISASCISIAISWILNYLVAILIACSYSERKNDIIMELKSKFKCFMSIFYLVFIFLNIFMSVITLQECQTFDLDDSNLWIASIFISFLIDMVLLDYCLYIFVFFSVKKMDNSKFVYLLRFIYLRGYLLNLEEVVD